MAEKYISDRMTLVLKFLKGQGISARKIASDIGVTETTISEVKNGRSQFSMAPALAIEQKFGIPSAWLMHGEGEWTPPPDGIQLVTDRYLMSIYCPLRGGCGEDGVDGEIVGQISCSEEYHRLKYFAMRVSGDSMAPRLNHGDVAIFRPFVKGEAINPKKIYCVCVEGWKECVAKLVEEQPDGIIRLISVNSAVHKPKDVNPALKCVNILGVLKERRTMEE
jgi:phage repressor protein C with HTH and peptisase S24 domain